MPTASLKREMRIEARLTKPQKVLIERAARLRGISVSHFLVASAQEAARSEVARETVIRLNPEESLRFAEAILHPEPMSPSLRARLRKYQRLYTDQVVLAF